MAATCNGNKSNPDVICHDKEQEDGLLGAVDQYLIAQKDQVNEYS